MNKNLIKTLDLNDFKAGGVKKKEFIEKFKLIAKETGFFFLENHGISQNTLEEANRLAKQFFTEIPEEARIRYEYPNEEHQRGYTPLRIETGEFSNIADEKHFFQVGDRMVPEVTEVKGLTDAYMNLFKEFKETYKVLLCVVALSLDLDEDYFNDKEGNSIMRSIHYPANSNPGTSETVTKGGNHIGMCASKHTDINILTLLHALEEGLQLSHNGKWIPVTISDSSVIIVNVGDMLEHLTSGLYKSGLHQVVCKKNVERFSIPFFGHVKEDVSIRPLPHLRHADLEEYHFKNAGEFLRFRLQQIGL